MALRKENFYNGYEQEKQPMKRVRITFDVSPELRKQIKKAASEQDISISKFLTRIIEEAMPENASPLQFEKKPLTRETLEHVLRVREEIIAHTGGYTFENSTEVVRQMREERSKEMEQL